MAKDTKHRRPVADLSEPQGFLWPALVPLAAPAVAGAKDAYDIWKGARPPVKPSDPLSFAVCDCVSQAEKYALTILCENLGVHGVYVEGFSLPKPEGNSTARVVPMPETILTRGSTMAFDPDPPSARHSLPVLIPPGKKALFEVTFDRFPPKRMTSKPYGALSVRYTVLGVAEKDLEKSVEFSVRP